MQIRCPPAARWRSTATDFPQRCPLHSPAHPMITLERGEIAPPPAEWDSVIIATGPLTSPGLAATIAGLTGEQQLAFFDAIAPIVHRDSIDLTQAWFQSRYDKVRPRRHRRRLHQLSALARTIRSLRCGAPVRRQDHVFTNGKSSTPYFDGCLPIEVMAERGPETLRHGPMKPFRPDQSAPAGL